MPSIVKANGPIKSLYVLVQGKEKHHPEAHSKVSWYQFGRKRFEDVGRDRADLAVAALNRREKALEAIAAGLKITAIWVNAIGGF